MLEFVAGKPLGFASWDRCRHSVAAKSVHVPSVMLQIIYLMFTDGVRRRLQNC
jgi:hypothetical protein